jgi:hypothetical protein
MLPASILPQPSNAETLSAMDSECRKTASRWAKKRALLSDSMERSYPKKLAVRMNRQSNTNVNPILGQRNDFQVL